jgi:hypothetical protein
MSDPVYFQAFKEAHQQACEALEAEARRRATEGWDEPVFQKGVQCGVVRKYSDQLLMFLMRGAMPDKYREHLQIESVETKYSAEAIMLSECLTPDELEQLQIRLLAHTAQKSGDPKLNPPSSGGPD